MALNFRAFIDDSRTPGGEFILAGHIAPAEAWAKFSKEWENLLPHGTLADNGKNHFKMSEMALTPERMERVPAFYWLIEEYTSLSVSSRMNIAEFGQAHERAKSFALNFGRSVDLDQWTNPYVFLFRFLIDHFHLERKRLEPVIPLSEKVDFYFDIQTESKYLLAAWDQYIEARPDEAKRYYGSQPRFEDDQGSCHFKRPIYGRGGYENGTKKMRPRCRIRCARSISGSGAESRDHAWLFLQMKIRYWILFRDGCLKVSRPPRREEGSSTAALLSRWNKFIESTCEALFNSRQHQAYERSP